MSQHHFPAVWLWVSCLKSLCLNFPNWTMSRDELTLKVAEKAWLTLSVYNEY